MLLNGDRAPYYHVPPRGRISRSPKKGTPTMRLAKQDPRAALGELVRSVNLAPETLDAIFQAIQKQTTLAPAPEVNDDLSPTMRDALARLATSTVEVAPTNESRAKLRWFRTMGALVKRGYAMQDHSPEGDHAFLITRSGTAHAIALGLVRGKAPRASGILPKAHVRKAG